MLHYPPSENFFCNVQPEPPIRGYTHILHHLPALRGVWFSRLLLTRQNPHSSQYILCPALSSHIGIGSHFITDCSQICQGGFALSLPFCPYMIGNYFQEDMLRDLSRD